MAVWSGTSCAKNIPMPLLRRIFWSSLRKAVPRPAAARTCCARRCPGYDVKDAWSRCRVLIAAGEACAVEVLPKGLPELLGSCGSDAEGVGIYFITGMTNSAPSLMPAGQRDVTVFRCV